MCFTWTVCTPTTDNQNGNRLVLVARTETGVSLGGRPEQSRDALVGGSRCRLFRCAVFVVERRLRRILRGGLELATQSTVESRLAALPRRLQFRNARHESLSGKMLTIALCRHSDHDM